MTIKEVEVEHEEIKGSNRILVVKYLDGNGEKVDNERIQVPVDASNDRIQRTLTHKLDKLKIGGETKNRIDELKEVAGNPVGLRVTPNIDAKKYVDDNIKYHKLKGKTNLSKEERKRRRELRKKSGKDSLQKSELEDLENRANLSPEEDKKLFKLG